MKELSQFARRLWNNCGWIVVYFALLGIFALAGVAILGGLPLW